MKETEHKNSWPEKRALVTGAGSGIGRATAVLMARRGARVALLGRGREELEATLEEIGGEAAGHLLLLADIGEESDMGAALSHIHQQWQRLDIVVANAGINGVWAPLEELRTVEWDATLATNLRGTFLTLRESLPLLRARGGAVV